MADRDDPVNPDRNEEATTREATGGPIQLVPEHMRATEATEPLETPTDPEAREGLGGEFDGATTAEAATADEAAEAEAGADAQAADAEANAESADADAEGGDAPAADADGSLAENGGGGGGDTALTDAQGRTIRSGQQTRQRVPTTGVTIDTQGNRTHVAPAQQSMGDALNQLLMLLAMLFNDPEMFPFAVETLYPEDDYTDPVERARNIERLETVVQDPTHPDRELPATEFIREYFPHLATGADTLIRPDLLQRLSTASPESSLRQYVNMTIDAVNEYNEGLSASQTPLDANLILNQIFQESRFQADAVGPQTRYGRAYGIAQFLPETGRRYGLSQSDLMNPARALPAAVRHIGDMTEEFGSQRLAMVAYNGGPRAVEWAAEELGKSVSELTIDDWMGYTDYLNERYGEGPSNLWRNQTNEYIALAHSDYWTDAQVQQATRLMRELGMEIPQAPALASTNEEPEPATDDPAAEDATDTQPAPMS